MSTSLLYHGFGIVGYRYIRTEYREGDIIFTVSRKKFGLRCPVCKSKKVIRRGSIPRWFHSLPIGKNATYIRTEVARVECKDCKVGLFRLKRTFDLKPGFVEVLQEKNHVNCTNFSW